MMHDTNNVHHMNCLIAVMGATTNIGSPAWLADHDWSTNNVIAPVPSVRHLVIIHLSIGLADFDQVKNAID